MLVYVIFVFQAEDGIRYLVRSRGLGDVYKRQVSQIPNNLVRILADKTTGWIVLVISLVVLLISVFAIVYIKQGTRYGNELKII